MKILRTTVLLCGLLSLQSLLSAAPSEGYVIQWSTDSAAKGGSSVTVVASNAIHVSAGWFHGLALRADGTVVGWGGNNVGNATGVPTTNAPYTSSGQVTIGGQPLSNVVSVFAARNHSLALKKDGTVVTWGENSVPSGLTDVLAIAGDIAGSWALKRDATVVGWLANPSWEGYGQLFPVDGLSNVVAISVGPSGHTTRGVALRNDGTVGHWGGESIHKDATPPAGLSNVVAVAAGAAHSLALKRDGTVVGWPTTDSPNDMDFISAGLIRIDGQILSNVVAIAAGSGYSLALKKDGTLVKWGDPPFRKMVIPAGLSNVVAIAAGAEDFCLAITTNAAVAERFRQ